MSAADHILVVDDDVEIRTLLSDYLEKNGYRVTAAADGKSDVGGARARTRPTSSCST